MTDHHACAALALDVDVTLTRADPAEISDFVDRAKQLGAEITVNTARPGWWCRRGADQTTLQYGIDVADHHCLTHMHPPTSKVINMSTIQSEKKIGDNACVILMDDRPENMKAIWKNGFSGIYTPHGIQKNHIDDALSTIRSCCGPHLKQKS